MRGVDEARGDQPDGVVYGIGIDPSRSLSREKTLLGFIAAISLIVPVVAAQASGEAIYVVSLVFMVVLYLTYWIQMQRLCASVEVRRAPDGQLWLVGVSTLGDALSAPLSEITAITKGSRFSHRKIRFAGQRPLGFQVNRNDLALFLDRLADDLGPGVSRDRLDWSSWRPMHGRFFDNTGSR